MIRFRPHLYVSLNQTRILILLKCDFCLDNHVAGFPLLHWPQTLIVVLCVGCTITAHPNAHICGLLVLLEHGVLLWRLVVTSAHRPRFQNRHSEGSSGETSVDVCRMFYEVNMWLVTFSAFHWRETAFGLWPAGHKVTFWSSCTPTSPASKMFPRFLNLELILSQLIKL